MEVVVFREMIKTLDDRLASESPEGKFSLQDAMAHTVIVLLSSYRVNRLNYSQMQQVISALPDPKRAIGRAIDMMDGIKQKEFYVRLRIGNNIKMSNVLEALVRDEPEVANEIRSMSDEDNVCLIIEHNFSDMTGKQVVVYAVSDVVDYISNSAL